MNYVRSEGRPISRIEPGDVIEKRVHGPASDGYLSIVTRRQIGGRDGEWFPGSPFELSPAQQKNLLAILADPVPATCAADCPCRGGAGGPAPEGGGR